MRARSCAGRSCCRAIPRGRRERAPTAAAAPRTCASRCRAGSAARRRRPGDPLPHRRAPVRAPRTRRPTGSAPRSPSCATAGPGTDWSPWSRSPSASACFIIDDSTASARFADPARVTERSSNQLRTSFAETASTRRSPKAGRMYRLMPSACERLVAGFHRSAQSARNAGPNVRIVGTVAGAPSACASPISARAACRASSTVSASGVPSVRLMTEPLHRRCTIHVLRPFGRARSPSPGAALSHSTASRPSTGAKARARAMVIFVLFVMFRSLPFVSVATGAARVPHVGEHPGHAG